MPFAELLVLSRCVCRCTILLPDVVAIRIVLLKPGQDLVPQKLVVNSSDPLFILVEEDLWHALAITSDDSKDHNLLWVHCSADPFPIILVQGNPSVTSPVVKLIDSEDLLVRADLHNQGILLGFHPCQKLLAALKSLALGLLRQQLLFPLDKTLDSQPLQGPAQPVLPGTGKISTMLPDGLNGVPTHQ